MKKNEQGFGGIAIVLVIMVLGVVLAAGYTVNKRQNDTNTDNNSATAQQDQSAANSTAAKTTFTKTTAGDGSIDYIDIATGISFNYPGAIKGDFIVSAYKPGDEIAVGHGAPVWLTYTESSDKWQTYKLSGAAKESTPTKVLTNDNFKPTTQKVGSKNTIQFVASDGATSQLSLAFYASGKVYRVQFPEIVEDTATGSSAPTQHSIQKESIEKIVQSLKTT